MEGDDEVRWEQTALGRVGNTALGDLLEQPSLLKQQEITCVAVGVG
jgi:hypothetical protein